MKKLFIFFYLLPFVLFAQHDDDSSKTKLGASIATSYSFTGIGLFLNLEVQKGHHVFYTGPKISVTRTYLPLKGPWGWNIGYRHDIPRPNKNINFFFNTEYQILGSKAFSQNVETIKRNFVHEAFIGYGVQVRLFNHFYLGNMMGIGGHIESYYNPDLEWRQTFAGLNKVFKIFIHYK